jgi:AcrR family transcriptional regulator
VCSCGRSVRRTPPRSRGAGWPSDEDEAREKLLAAADACYAEKEPVRTRMSEMARRAGVHRATVYDYFAQKIRRDLSADTLARWIVRFNFSFTAEPGKARRRRRRGLLRNLLIAPLDPVRAA